MTQKGAFTTKLVCQVTSSNRLVETHSAASEEDLAGSPVLKVFKTSSGSNRVASLLVTYLRSSRNSLVEPRVVSAAACRASMVET